MFTLKTRTPEHPNTGGSTMFRIVPQLVVADIDRSVGFYSNVLGFVVALEDPEGAPEFVSLEREDASLFLVSAASRTDQEGGADLGPGKKGAGVRIYFEVNNASDFYKQVKDSGATIVRELTHNEAEDYSEFLIADPDGYEIGIYS
jgi:predicted enzyme related to lactoylglutathione lyase